MATITACEPNRPAISLISSGLATAAELMLTLSAPASNILAASSSVRTPPPTVKGTNSSRAVRRTVSTRVLRLSEVAVMSSRTISSAPASACVRASSAGSPASRSCWNWMPFTTRPTSTSRQAMMRLARHGVSGKPGWGLLGRGGSEGTKILQNFQAGLRRFFRVKLHAKNIFALYRRGECSAILWASDCVSNDRSAERMCVVNERAVLHPAQQARVTADLDLVPAYVRRFDGSRKARALTGKESRTGRLRRFRAALKEPLHAHTNSQKGLAHRNAFQH